MHFVKLRCESVSGVEMMFSSKVVFVFELNYWKKYISISTLIQTVVLQILVLSFLKSNVTFCLSLLTVRKSFHRPFDTRIRDIRAQCNPRKVRQVITQVKLEPTFEILRKVTRLKMNSSRKLELQINGTTRATVVSVIVVTVFF